MSKQRREGLYKQPSSPYWYIDFTDENGRRRRVSSKTTSRTEAKHIRSELLHRARMGRFTMPVHGSATVKDLAKKYKKWATTQKDYDTKSLRIKTWIIPILGTTPLYKMNAAKVEALQQAVMKKGRSAATCNRIVACLKHMMTQACRWEMVSPEVLAKVRQATMMREPPGRIRYLSQDETDKLLSSCDHKLKPIVLVAITTGMRRGEILNLKWDDVDLKNGFLHIRDSKSGRARSIPIEEPLKTVMKKLPRHIGSEWVFWTGDRGEVRKGIQRAWATAVRKAQIDNLRFHDLRHHAASTMVMQGVPLYTVKEVLGHASVKTTERYAHLSSEHIRDKIKRVESTGSD